jgi:hypothetical protein
MKKALLVLPVIAAAIAFGGPTSSTADENPLGVCPDHYTPFPAVFLDEDRNGNGVVCLKLTPGTEVAIVHDDPNGQPYRCNGTAMTRPECAEDIDDDPLL